MTVPNNSKLADKIAIVTGGGYGIGKAIALALAGEGARIILAARSEDKLQAVAGEIRKSGGAAEAVRTDVSDEASVEAMCARAVEVFGGIDILINNAGIAGPTKLATDITAVEWNETIAIDLTGAFFCSKHAAAWMIEHGGGTMVNISSVGGRLGYPMRTPYAAAKWGMIGLGHSLAAELGPRGVRVNCVCPGPVAGERIERVIRARSESAGVSLEQAQHQVTGNIPLGRLVTEEEVAKAVLYFAGPDSAGVTGQVFNVCGGMRMQ